MICASRACSGIAVTETAKKSRAENEGIVAEQDVIINDGVCAKVRSGSYPSSYFNGGERRAKWVVGSLNICKF